MMLPCAAWHREDGGRRNSQDEAGLLFTNILKLNDVSFTSLTQRRLIKLYQKYHERMTSTYLDWNGLH